MERIDRVIQYYNLSHDIGKEELLKFLQNKISVLDQEIKKCKRKKEREHLKKEQIRAKGFKSIVENHGITIPTYEEEEPKSKKRNSKYYLRTKPPEVKAPVKEGKKEIKPHISDKKKIPAHSEKKEVAKPVKKKRVSPLLAFKKINSSLLAYFNTAVGGIVGLGRYLFTKVSAGVFTVIFLFIYFQHREPVLGIIESSRLLVQYQLYMMGALALGVALLCYGTEKRGKNYYEPVTTTLAGMVLILGFLNFYTMGFMLVNLWAYDLDAEMVSIAYGVLINGVLVISIYFAGTLGGLIGFGNRPKALKGYYSFWYLFIMYGVQQGNAYFDVIESSFQFLFFIIAGSYVILYYLDEPLLEITPYEGKNKDLTVYKNPYRPVRRIGGRFFEVRGDNSEELSGLLTLWGLVLFFVFVSGTMRDFIRNTLQTLHQLGEMEVAVLIAIGSALWLGKFHRKIPLCWEKLYNDFYNLTLYLLALYVLKGVYYYFSFGASWLWELSHILLAFIVLIYMVNRNSQGYRDLRIPIAVVISILGEYAFYEYEVFQGRSYILVLTTILPVALAYFTGKAMNSGTRTRAHR